MRTKEEIKSFVDPKVIPGYWNYGNGHMVIWRVARVFVHENWCWFNVARFKSCMKEIAKNYFYSEEGLCEDEVCDYNALFNFLNS